MYQENIQMEQKSKKSAFGILLASKKLSNGKWVYVKSA